MLRWLMERNENSFTQYYFRNSYMQSLGHVISLSSFKYRYICVETEGDQLGSQSVDIRRNY